MIYRMQTTTIINANWFTIENPGLAALAMRGCNLSKNTHFVEGVARVFADFSGL